MWPFLLARKTWEDSTLEEIGSPWLSTMAAARSAVWAQFSVA